MHSLYIKKQCIALQLNQQMIYSPVRIAYVILVDLIPLWVMLHVFRPVRKDLLSAMDASSDKDRLFRAGTSGSYPTIVSGRICKAMGAINIAFCKANFQLVMQITHNLRLHSWVHWIMLSQCNIAKPVVFFRTQQMIHSMATTVHDPRSADVHYMLIFQKLVPHPVHNVPDFAVWSVVL